MYDRLNPYDAGLHSQSYEIFNFGQYILIYYFIIIFCYVNFRFNCNSIMNNLLIFHLSATYRQLRLKLIIP